MGKKKFMPALLAALMLITAIGFGAAPTALAQTDDTPEFIDVPGYHPALDEIEYCVKNNFMLGYGDGTFRPEGNITRGQFVTVWARTFHARKHNFSDVTKTADEVDNAIVLMHGLGYINGISATLFNRNASITREQVAQIIVNTYLAGVDGHDMYQAYTDSSQVSDWAQDAVSIMREKGIFNKITTNNRFQPQRAVTRAEVCMLIYNLMQVQPVKYDITVAAMTNGDVTTNKATAAAGETVTLDVEPDEDYRLKAGTLKANETVISGDSFIMPAEDVTITAEFEEIPILTSIAVKTAPKDDYTVGDTLDITGLVITASYSNYPDKDLTSGFTTTPAAGTKLETAETVTVTVSYTENEITKEATFDVTVNAAPTSGD